MKVRNDDLLGNLDGVDLTANIVSEPIWVGHIANIALQISYSGASIAGNFKLQGSCDKQAVRVADSTVAVWSDLSGTTSAAAASGGDVLWNLENIGYSFVRLVWTDTSTSSGSIDTARTMTKGV